MQSLGKSSHHGGSVLEQSDSVCNVSRSIKVGHYHRITLLSVAHLSTSLGFRAQSVSQVDKPELHEVAPKPTQGKTHAIRLAAPVSTCLACLSFVSPLSLATVNTLIVLPTGQGPTVASSSGIFSETQDRIFHQSSVETDQGYARIVC